MALWSGSLGRTVRCVPSRRTLIAEHGGRTLYAKRYPTRAGADREWRWVSRLAAAGFRVAQPVGLIRSHRGSLAVFGAVPGRSLDAWAVTARGEGWLNSWLAYVVGEVAPLVRQLHAQRWIHRDLNCAHLFAVDPLCGGAPALIDVERMMRPRWRWQRWVVKDLASLLASCQGFVSARAAMRFLRVYTAGQTRGARHKLAKAVLKKAGKISRHRPRFG